MSPIYTVVVIERALPPKVVGTYTNKNRALTSALIYVTSACDDFHLETGRLYGMTRMDDEFFVNNHEEGVVLRAYVIENHLEGA